MLDSHSRPSSSHHLGVVHMSVQLCDYYGKRGTSKEGVGSELAGLGRCGREVEGTVMARLMGHFSLRPTGIVWTIKERGIKIKRKALQPFLKAPSR